MKFSGDYSLGRKLSAINNLDMAQSFTTLKKMSDKTYKEVLDLTGAFSLPLKRRFVVIMYLLNWFNAPIS